MKQKYFIHKFTRYFFIFSLPVIIIGLLLTVYSFFQIRENSNTQAQSSFQASSQLMEEILAKGDDIADMMNTNSGISMSMYRILNQNSMNYKENVTKNIMFNILENLKSSFSYINSVYVYFPNEKDYFFQTTEKLTSIQDSADRQWLSDFKEHTPDEDKWIVLRSFQNYHFEKEHPAITIYRRIRYYGGVLVVNLNQSVLSELLSSLENYPNESIFVTNSEGHVLFSNANADKLHFKPDQGIHEQLSLPLTDTGHYLSSVKYNKHSYVLTEFTYPDYDLHFLSLVPSRDIYRLLYNIRKHEIIRIYESSIIFDTIAPNQGRYCL